MHPNVSLNGLVALLENENVEDNPNQEPEYVPIPLTDVNIHVRVVNFNGKVRNQNFNKSKNAQNFVHMIKILDIKNCIKLSKLHKIGKHCKNGPKLLKKSKIFKMV